MFRHSCYGLYIAHLSTLDNPIRTLYAASRFVSLPPTSALTHQDGASPSARCRARRARLRHLSRRRARRPSAPARRTRSSRCSQLKAASQARARRPRRAHPIGRSSGATLGRWCVCAPLPLTLRATRWHATLVSPDAHDGCVFSREAHRRRARGGRLLPTRAGWALPVRPLR